MTHGGRENLMIMEAVTTKFRKQNKVTISFGLAVVLGLLFVGCLVATGLLVNSFSSCANIPNVQSPAYNDINEDPFVLSEKPITFAEVTSSTTQQSTSIPEYSTKRTEADLDVRLPRSILPQSYKIKLIPFLQEGNFTFHGDVNILVNVTETTDKITLHADELNIEHVKVYNVQHETVSIKAVRNESKKQFLIIELHEPLQASVQLHIEIKFTGILNDLLQGFYRSYYIENNETRWIAATQFQATDARRAFPCFDEPALKAKFQISIARLKNMTSISNMRKLNYQESLLGMPDYIWDHYEESLPMSTYLVAFLISDFQNISNGNFSIWARPSALSQAKYSLSIGPKILKYYEKFFGIKYPLPKLDMVAIPDFPAGAMENWGLITYREPVLLYEEGVSSKTSLHRIAHVVAHELAHQWFGNLVTPTWWTDLWLNEGFATYVEFLGANEVEPKWKDPDLFLVTELHGSFGLDALKSSHQISIIVNDPDEIDDIFDRISYSKGASIIRMMQHFLTFDVFHKGLNKYLNSRLYGSAEQDDLWNVLTEQSHEDGILDENITIKQIMDTWTLQTGFPLITAKRIYDDNSKSLTFTQERFLLNKGNTTDETLWWVPVTYTNPSGNLENIWMNQVSTKTIENFTVDDDDWILVNVNQTGYYRVNYDSKNWQMLINQLQMRNGHLLFDQKNRAQLLDDAMNLAFVGDISYHLALEVTAYLKQEREYLPWKAAFNSLDYLCDMFERTGHFDKFKVYMLQLIDGLYKEVGFKDSINDEPLDILKRTEVVDRACQLGMRDCIIKAVQQFQNWKNTANPDEHNSISPDLRQTIYCTAISDGGQEEWDFAWQRYLNTNVANEKEILLSALGCSKETWILNRYLEWSITENSGIRKHDSPSVFASVSDNSVGQDLAYRFMKTNWARIRSYLGSSTMSLNSLVRSSTAKFNTEEEINDFRGFFLNKHKEIGIALRTVQQTIERAEANVKWMSKYFNQIVHWLSNKTS